MVRTVEKPHWIVLIGMSLGLALLAALAGGASGGRAFLGCGGEIIPPSSVEFEQQLVVLVNQERASAGLPPLKLVGDLSYAARYHAADLGGDDYFEHDTYDRSPDDLEWVCQWWERVEAFYPAFDTLGENIAAGASTPQMAMELWLGSSGHRANILSPDYSEIGIGYARADSAYQHYWVQDFSSGEGFPLVIEGEMPAAASPLVAVYLYGSFTEMRLRVDEGEWSEWLPFQNSFTWELPATRGEHTLYAEMRSAQTWAETQDSIYLDYEEIIPTPEPVPFVPTHYIFIPFAGQQKSP